MAEIKERSYSEFPNDSDTISRQAAIDKFISSPMFRREVKMGIINVLEDMPSSDVIRCKDCKYFDLDHFEQPKNFPMPIIVAHEICTRWGQGCKTDSNGWCFLAERSVDNE